MKLLVLFSTIFNYSLVLVIIIALRSIFHFRKRQVQYQRHVQQCPEHHAIAYSYKVLWFLCIAVAALFTIILVLNGCNAPHLSMQ